MDRTADAEPVSPPRAVQTFQYAKPAFAGLRAVVELCEGENLRAEMHVARPGGALARDGDSAADSVWLVLRGRARVLGARETLIGEFAPGDGLLVPRGTAVRIESVAADDLEILEVTGFDRGRVPASPDGADGEKVARLVGRVL
jgi:mannose-6-phosphate isomerase-like protein (cupin superfamily)